MAGPKFADKSGGGSGEKPAGEAGPRPPEKDGQVAPHSRSPRVPWGVAAHPGTTRPLGYRGGAAPQPPPYLDRRGGAAPPPCLSPRHPREAFWPGGAAPSVPVMRARTPYEQTGKDHIIGMLGRAMIRSDPDKKLYAPGNPEELVNEAALKLAAFWVKTGQAERARVLANTYGLDWANVEERARKTIEHPEIPLPDSGGVAPPPPRELEEFVDEGVAPPPARPPTDCPCAAPGFGRDMPPFAGRGRQLAGEGHFAPYTEEKALHLEKEGKYDDAAHEFWGSVIPELRKADPRKAIELLEKAALNYLRAKNGGAVMAFMELMRLDRGAAIGAAERLVRFCGEEEARIEGTEPNEAAYLCRVAEHIRELAEGKS